MFHHRYRYIFVLLLTAYTFINTVLCDVYYYFRIDIEWYFALLTIFLVTIISWEGNRLIEPIIRRAVSPATKKIRYLAIFFLIGNLVAGIAALSAVWMVGFGILGKQWNENLNPLKLNVIYAGLVNLFFHLINAIYFFFQEYRRHWKEVEELRRVSSQAQVQLVKSQINPHFLFNNLNVLSGMVIRDNPEANHFIEEFSKVYRYVLNNQDKELVELRSELDFIRPYIFLLRKRFDNGLHININVAEKFSHHLIIPIALQMLIENAIKHNIVSSAKPLTIDININVEQNTLVVSNNLQPRLPGETSTRIGLKNIQQRYELISGRPVMVKRTDAVFEVTLPLLSLN